MYSPQWPQTLADDRGAPGRPEAKALELSESRAIREKQEKHIPQARTLPVVTLCRLISFDTSFRPTAARQAEQVQ